jgi:nucleoside 2-deoxyribosyltransferase
MNVEKEELRPLGLAIRNFSARMNTMPARPIWRLAKVSVDTNAVFYSGAAQGRKSVAAICRRSGLELMAEPRGESYASARWKQLQKAVTAVFDLRVTKGPDMATANYELGVAMTLGKPIVILIAEGQSLPFDVDIDPTVLSGGPQDTGVIAMAIDQSIFWTYPRLSGDAPLKTLEHVLALYSRPHQDIYVDQTLRMLSDLRKTPDPLAITRTLVTLFDYLKDGETMLIHPRWSPVYAEEDKRRLFHVMPFTPKEWADKITEVTRKVCEAASVKYVRGDEVDEPNVIRSIWEEIARATHVLVDLTGFNANVALELGIAHTLGKRILRVGQADPASHVFKSISKFRVQSYDAQRLKETLGREIRDFLRPSNI